MKNLSKFMLTLAIIFAVLILIAGIFIFIVWNNSNKIELEKSKLLSPFSNLIIYDSKNEEIENVKSSYQGVTFDELNSSTIDAFTSIEDKRFFEHNGIDLYRIGGAIYQNIKTHSLKEGASTITQQLVKNTLLTNEKTIDRKITELFLSQKLEKYFSKQEILSMYLSAIYFGNGQYGIKNASKYYFDKEPINLTVSESAVLAGMIKSPTKYCPITNYDNAIKRKNIVLRKMFENQKISKAEFDAFTAETVAVMQNSNKTASFFNYVVLEACDKLKITENELFSGNFIIYTNFNEEYNAILDDAAKISKYPTTTLLIDNKTHCVISTYESRTKNSLYKKDNPASLIKPILVYSVAVDENIISPLTIFEDKQTSWNGFSPSNNGDLYYGDVSMRFALEKSLNIPAIKTFNAIPNKVLKNVGEKMNISISDDENLTFAIGGIKDGMSVMQLGGAFATMANDGKYSTPSFITKIENSKNKVLYRKLHENTSVFSEETAYIISDMLKSVANNGTARTLFNKFNLENVCAKTGTNGTAKGNYESYSVVYNRQYTLVTKIEKADELLPNNVS
ncbi:MAG: transglycosylase domain-containing protein, partial [Clostridia bacterium]